MTMQTGRPRLICLEDSCRISRSAMRLLILTSACFVASHASSQQILTQGTPIANVPVIYSPSGNAATIPLNSFGNTTPWLLNSDIHATPAQMKITGSATPATIVASGAPSEDSKPSAVEIIVPGATSMPPSMTSPLLPNVPSSLSEDKVKVPAQTGTPTVGAPVALPTPTVISDTPVTDPVTPVTDQAPAAPKNAALEGKAASDLEESARSGPALRKSFSALFTQQRPFLLYSQDASITYLMPNALVDHPKLSRYLRDILEERALQQWQSQRQAPQPTAPATAQNSTSTTTTEAPLAAAAAPTEPATTEPEPNRIAITDPDLLEERPALVITGRVEDRFYSPTFTSLYLEEIKSIDGQKRPTQILSFNFDNTTDSAFGLQDLFVAKDEKELAGTIELIDAYIQTDIVRQKSIRLGTLVRPDQDAWLKDLKPSLALLQNFTLVPSRETSKIAGLSFHFNPGLLGAEADGQYDVYVPAAIFSAALSPRFAEHFGGEALRVSRHNAKGFSAASVNIEGLRSGDELGGDMLIEGEVPGNWCNGFHITLSDRENSQIITEGVVKLLPDLPTYGLASNMMRFRAELSVTGDGEKPGSLMFEPYAVEVKDNHVLLQKNSACDPLKPISMPDPLRDLIAIDVNY
ncbi:hypothetical protein [uncultured Cohaesibacter sp.]|uniref:hypothetical protein n=1 Tax=uncultured Cohaesibacter sp. TaxID=1002546 RepID=UPI0029C66112|nr:hypothetical protein [uncultured Cohaesibacter sp.]